MVLSHLVRIRQDGPCLPADSIHGIGFKSALELSTSTLVLAHFTFGQLENDFHLTVEGFRVNREIFGAFRDPLIDLTTVKEVGRARSFALVNGFGEALLLEEPLQGVTTDTSQFQHLSGGVGAGRGDCHG